MVMDKKIQKIVKELKAKISSKYEIDELKVFGSSARDERREDSDIDVYLLIPEMNRQIEEDLFDIAYDLELKYDCLIDLIVFDKQALKGKYTSAPVYEKVLSEGLSI
jgi:predicted nucleotidyltransferase